MGRCRDCVASLLGVCGGDFCQAERTALVERAESLAAQLDHDLDSFEKVKGRPVWRSKCRFCGLGVAITIDPEPGQPAIWGKAVDRGREQKSGSVDHPGDDTAGCSPAVRASDGTEPGL